MNCAWPIGNPQPGRPTILVVDHEILSRLAIAGELRQQGFNVAEAASAEEALSILHSGIPVDLMLADLSEPGIQDISSLVVTVRTDYPNVKVLIAAPQDGPKVEDITIDGMLSKPYDSSKVANLIKILLDP